MQIAFITKVDLKNRLFIRISDWKHEKAGFQPFLGDFFLHFWRFFSKFLLIQNHLSHGNDILL